MNRLTPEALDALLAEHHSCCGEAPTCEKPHCMATYCNSNWPCSVYLLASEVRDARQGKRHEFWDKSFPQNPQPGDQSWSLKWELADGTFVTVNMGREGYANFRKMLLWEATDDAIDEALAHYEEGSTQ